METDKTKKCRSEIIDLRFITNHMGNVNPVLVLKDENDNGTDSILFNSVREFSNELITGTQIEYKMDEIGVVKDFETLPGSPEFNYRLPDRCDCCNSPLVAEDGNLLCSNQLCPRLSIAPLRLLLMLATKKPISLINIFLKEFPFNDEKFNIENSYEFQKVFFKVTAKNTASREQNWLDINSALGTTLWEMECSVYDYLAQPKLMKNAFWRILNFPYKNEQEFYDIVKIDPKKLMELHGEEISRVSDTFRTSQLRMEQLTANGLELIQLWNNIFEALGPKEWR